jgi:TIR domain
MKTSKISDPPSEETVSSKLPKGGADIHTGERRSFLEKIQDWLFGRDFFISYRWEDGRPYAVQLTEKLRERGYNCFLDSDSYLKGDLWPRVGERELKKTARLVLVGTPKVHDSKPVARELKVFGAKGDRIFAIEFGDSLSLSRFPDSPILQELDPTVLRQVEASGAENHPPSATVIEELIRTFAVEKTEVRGMRAIKLTACALLLLLCASLVAAWIAILQQWQAELATNSAHNALVTSFRRTIGSSDGSLSKIEIDALWELSLLEKRNEPVRKLLLSKWADEPPIPMAPLFHNRAGLHAVNGGWGGEAVDPLKFCECLVTALEKSEEIDPARLSALNKALVSVSGKLPPDQAEPLLGLATRLVTALEKPEVTDSDRLSALSEGLVAVARKLSKVQAESLLGLATRLVTALEKSVETDSGRVSALSKALVAVTRSLTEVQAEPLLVRAATQLVVRLEKPVKEKDLFRPFELSEGIVAVTAMLSSAQAEPLLGLTTRLVTVLERTEETDSDRLRNLSEGLVALTGTLTTTQAEPLLVLATSLITALEKSKEMDSNRLGALSEVLMAVTRNLTSNQSEMLLVRAAARLVVALENPVETDSDRLRALSEVLVAVTRNLTSAQAEPLLVRAAARLIIALEEAPRRLGALNAGLVAVTDKLTTVQAESLLPFVQQLVTALEKPVEEHPPYRFHALGAAVTSVSKKLTTAQAGDLLPLVQCLVAALRKPVETRPPYRLLALSTAMISLCKNLTAAHAKDLLVLAQDLVIALEETADGNSDRLRALSEALVSVNGKLPPDQAEPLLALAARLVTALEKPEETDSDSLGALSEALASVSGKLTPDQAKPLHERASRKLLAVISTKPNSKLVPSLFQHMYGQPNRRQTELFALAALFPEGVSEMSSEEKPSDPKTEPKDRKAVRETCMKMDKQTLAEILKWPVCVGEAEKIVLGVLEEKLKAEGKVVDFHGNVWELAWQAKELGIVDGEKPPVRPTLKAAMEELRFTPEEIAKATAGR